MIRVLLFAVLAGLSVARASDKINAAADGASAAVTQPHVVAELIPETTTVEAGKPFDVALHLKMDAGWHTYWINPGDAGLATTIKWTLPPGFTAGPIQWPTPEQHAMGPLVTYGYAGDVYFLTTITPPVRGDLPQHFDLKAKAEWLVCKEECIPGKAELTIPMDSGFLNLNLPVENTELFKEAKGRLPAENTRWLFRAFYGVTGNESNLSIATEAKSGLPSGFVGTVEFYPEQNNVLPATPIPTVALGDKARVLVQPLAQNGEKPDKLSGVLVGDKPLIGDAKAVHVADFPVAAKDDGPPIAQPWPPQLTGGIAAESGAAQITAPGGATPAADAGDGHRPPLQLNGEAAPAAGAGVTEPGAGPAPADSGATAPAGASTERTGGSLPLQGAQPLLIGVLGAAFLGGLILNLMPCVLPVLSLKVFALIRHAGEHPEKAWRQGAAFTAGVVVSFWALGGLLLALRAAGNHLGWGFQMQSPGFVVAMMLLFFLLGLNLLGVFEIGGSLVGLDAKAASRAGGGVSSFLNGALATLAATPCTAPFMGSALGFAAQQPAIVSMLIFTFLALGMAMPYLLLTVFPQSLKFVPKPGAWMESLKQFMGFLLLGTVIYYVYCFVALVGEDELVSVLSLLLLAGLAAWVYGRWTAPTRPPLVRTLATVKTIFLLGCVGVWAAFIVRGADATGSAGDGHRPPLQQAEDGWQPWSPEAVQAALAKGQPVFVDFTAAWCLSCKVNERVALGTDGVKKAFADKKVALFRADWTKADPVISQTLQKFNRDGVPLYLLYSPKSPEVPQVLPEALTPGIVLEALGKI